MPVMLIHDGILSRAAQSTNKSKQAKEIMVKLDATSAGVSRSALMLTRCLSGGARYTDKRTVAKKMWCTIMDALESAGDAEESVRWQT